MFGMALRSMLHIGRAFGLCVRCDKSSAANDAGRNMLSVRTSSIDVYSVGFPCCQRYPFELDRADRKKFNGLSVHFGGCPFLQRFYEMTVETQTFFAMFWHIASCLAVAAKGSRCFFGS